MNKLPAGFVRSGSDRSLVKKSMGKFALVTSRMSLSGPPKVGLVMYGVGSSIESITAELYGSILITADPL